jgi:hypothetical protein
MSRQHDSLEVLQGSLENHLANSGVDDSTQHAAENLYSKAADSLRRSRQAHNRQDISSANSLLHHAGGLLTQAAKLHGAGSSISSINALVRAYAGEHGGN